MEKLLFIFFIFGFIFRKSFKQRIKGFLYGQGVGVELVND